MFEEPEENRGTNAQGYQSIRLSELIFPAVQQRGWREVEAVNQESKKWDKWLERLKEWKLWSRTRELRKKQKEIIVRREYLHLRIHI